MVSEGEPLYIAIIVLDEVCILFNIMCDDAPAIPDPIKRPM